MAHLSSLEVVEDHFVDCVSESDPIMLVTVETEKYNISELWLLTVFLMFQHFCWCLSLPLWRTWMTGEKFSFFLLNAYCPFDLLDQVLNSCFDWPMTMTDCVEQLPGDKRS